MARNESPVGVLETRGTLSEKKYYLPYFDIFYRIFFVLSSSDSDVREHTVMLIKALVGGF